MLLNPAAADGLLACTGEQVGFAGPNEATQINNNEFSASLPVCPDQAKVGTVKIKTPVLKKPLEGSVYLASQNTNPFRSPLVLYIIAQDPESGVLVKLAGTTTPNPVTGQITSTFENTPPVPFEELERVEHVAEMLAHLAAGLVHDVTQAQHGLVRRPVEHQRPDRHQRVEPASGLVDGLGDVLRGVVALELLDAHPRFEQSQTLGPVVRVDESL